MKDVSEKNLPEVIEKADDLSLFIFAENNAKIRKLLIDANYTILHRPYFAMRGSTRKVLTINPCTKIAIDAAYISKQPMELRELLAYFES